MKVTGRLVAANGRAELQAEGEVFSAPARYAGRRVTLEIEDFALPSFLQKQPGVVDAIFPGAQRPAEGGSVPQSINPAGGPGRIERVVTPEDLEVLGT